MGYNQTVAVAKGKFIALAVQFEGTDGGSVAVTNLIQLASPTGTPTIGASADQIWRWNTAAADWDKYFYRSGRGVTNPGWTKAGETAPTTDTVSAGETVFFSRAGSAAAVLTLSGGVKEYSAEPSYSVAKGKFVFMGYPWPMEFAIANLTSCYGTGTSPTGTPTIGASADQVWRWNTTAADWDKYFYRSGRGVDNPGWTKAGQTAPTEDVIPVGEGFFFSRAGSATVTITFTNAGE